MANKHRILIVDDQALFAEGLKHVIEGEGGDRFEVIGIASNGKEAVDLCTELKPEVVLMDVRMPVMDGVEAAQAVSGLGLGIKIMMLTTFDDDELVFDALNSGANGYVLKNIPPAHIIPAIDAVRTGALFVSPAVGYRLIGGDGAVLRRDDESSLLSAIVAKLPNLTVREAEIVEQVLRARRNPQIADVLCISEKTVRNHISAIYTKLGIHNRLRLMSLISELGITSRQTQ